MFSPWILQVGTLEIRRLLQYRFDFWLTSAGRIFGHIALSYAVWAAVFLESGKSTIGGFNFQEIMAYYLISGLINNALTPGFGVVSDQIYRGELTKYLLYPVSTRGYMSALYGGKCLVYGAQAVVATLVFGLLFGVGFLSHISVSHLFLVALTLAIAAALQFLLTFLVEMFAFWFDEVWALIVSMQIITGALGGGMLPLSIFPEGLASILGWLPFSCMVALPSEMAMGRLDSATALGQIGVGLGWICLLFLTGSVLWQRGRRRYTGVGI